MVEPGRILSAQRAIVSGTSGELFRFIPALRIDAVYEQVGVISGLADKGQHFTIVRVYRDQRAAIFAERLLGDLLQLYINAQYQCVTGNGRGARKHAHRAATRINFNLLYARGTVQVAFVALLQAGFADVIRAAIICRQIVIFKPAYFFIVDAPDIAQQM